jgi:hypothetical protein
MAEKKTGLHERVDISNRPQTRLCRERCSSRFDRYRETTTTTWTGRRSIDNRKIKERLGAKEQEPDLDWTGQDWTGLEWTGGEGVW